MKNGMIIILMSFVLQVTPCTMSISYADSKGYDEFITLSNYYFKKYVRKGLVNYRYAKTNINEIRSLCQLAGELNLEELSPQKRKAFYINVYNLLVIWQTVNNYPISKPMDKIGFFDIEKHKVGGELLTLDQIEHDKLIGAFHDPRIHFVLACGAMSCPKLGAFAYKANNLDDTLEKRAAMAINDGQFIQVDDAHRSIRISKIFEWYTGHFVKKGESIITYLNKYRVKKIPPGYTVEYYPYDWTLNERTM